LNEGIQCKIFYYLKKNKIKKIVRVPDYTLKHFIDKCLKNDSIIISTSKERNKKVSWEPKTIRGRVMKSFQK
jgi:hypothetical protein|tara:strand:+ start:183 stop:398 length:216 start_codon:yes stop_codon:yes gene_type:complete